MLSTGHVFVACSHDNDKDLDVLPNTYRRGWRDYGTVVFNVSREWMIGRCEADMCRTTGEKRHQAGSRSGWLHGKERKGMVVVEQWEYPGSAGYLNPCIQNECLRQIYWRHQGVGLTMRLSTRVRLR